MPNRNTVNAIPVIAFNLIFPKPSVESYTKYSILVIRFFIKFARALIPDRNPKSARKGILVSATRGCLGRN